MSVQEERNERILNCINCGETILDSDKLKKYPESFSVYKCRGCGYLNDGWILYDRGEKVNRESIIRSIFFESYLIGFDLEYDKVAASVINQLSDEELRSKDIYDDLNRLFKKELDKKNVKAKRLPENRLHDERFNTIKISRRNHFEDFFNKRIIRPWDLRNLKNHLEEIRTRVSKNKNIRYKDRWIVAIDYFLSHE